MTVNVYGLFEDGKLADSGTADELGRKYYVNPQDIRGDARGGNALFRCYTVEKIGTREIEWELKETNQIILDCAKRGMSRQEIAERCGISVSSVCDRVRRLRKKGLL